jgi:ATP-dependent protease HslVU (ClpYQ) peptidase subunit
MTIVAAIYPPSRLPIFVSDTLISVKGTSVRVAGPTGLVHPTEGAEHRAHSLEQKAAIINDFVYIAYAGTTFLAKGIIRRLERRLSETVGSKVSATRSALDEEVEDLNRHNTTLLVAVIEDGECHHMSFGPEPDTKILDNGTTIYAVGTGAEDFLALFETAASAQLTVRRVPWWVRLGTKYLWKVLHSRWLSRVWRPRFDAAHQLDLAVVFAVIAEVSAYESLMAEIKAHFGQILEIGRGTQEGFEKLQSVTIMTELLTYQNEEATHYTGNYLNYAYERDILIYRRFGDIRRDEMHQAFGTDYLAGAVPPVLRGPPSEETAAAINRLLGEKVFNKSVLQIISYNDVKDVAKRKLTFSEPDHNSLRIERRDDHFEIFRSHEYMRQLADRLRVKKVVFP